jgi:xanthine dehydrogenase YagR molybdenum-binding subunit
MAEVRKAKIEFEGQIHEEFIVVEGEGLSAWEPGAELEFVGRGKARVDGAERVSGRARYTCDIQLPGMLYGKILRSPHPHARVKGIETRGAEELAGVRAVLSYQNIPRIPFFGGQTFLLDEILRYVGDEIACVLAEEEEICEDALEKIIVEYGRLPFVLDAEEALKPEAPKVQTGGNLFKGAPDLYERGDVRQGLGEADVVVEEAFRTQVALHNSLETHGSVALWQDDLLTVWDSTQHIFGVRAALAAMLNIPLHRVRVIKKYMGGGFGSKNSMGKYTLLAALGAKMTGRPVRIMLDRREENLAAGNRPSSKQYLKIGAKRDGSLTAIDLRAISGAGAYAYFPPAVGGPVRQLYSCPNVRAEQYTVFTNTGPMSAFRGPGYVEGTFALESAMDELARRLGMDPVTLRMKNYSDRNQVTGQPYSTKGLQEAYERGAQIIHWQERKGETRGARRRGFGMASQIWGGSGGPPAYALVKLNTDGSATVLSGTQDLGTGTKTALAQIAAEELGLAMEEISVEIGDTQMAPYAPISAGSMTLPSMGPAVRVAAHDARTQLLEVAAQVLGIPRESMGIHQGLFLSPALQKPVAIRDVLSGLRNFMVIGRGARAPNPEGVHVNTFGAQFVDLEVDTQTGEVHINKIIAVHDCGRVVNPLTISSQIEGGILQGLGFGLMEQRVVDRATGAVLNADLEDYKVATALDVPEIIQEMVDRPDLKANNLGVKGVGEPPIIPTAAAVANAIADALGVRIRELPITKEKILKALGNNPPLTG